MRIEPARRRPSLPWFAWIGAVSTADGCRSSREDRWTLRWPALEIATAMS